MCGWTMIYLIPIIGQFSWLHLLTTMNNTANIFCHNTSPSYILVYFILTEVNFIESWKWTFSSHFIILFVICQTSFWILMTLGAKDHYAKGWKMTCTVDCKAFRRKRWIWFKSQGLYKGPWLWWNCPSSEMKFWQSSEKSLQRGTKRQSAVQNSLLRAEIL